MTIIPFADFAPDRSPFDAATTDTLRNVLPKLNSWGPFPSITGLTVALEAQPRGAFMAVDSSGNKTIFAGTADKLWKLNSGTLDWDDVSQALTTYSVPDGYRWEATQHGDRVVFNNRNDDPQYWDLGSSTTFLDLPGSPPKARVNAVIGDFLMLGETESNPRGIRWSGLDDTEFWTIGAKNSGDQILPDGRSVVAIKGMEKGGIIFQEDAVRAFQLQLGTPIIAQIFKLEEKRGAVSGPGVVSVGRECYFLAQDGFYVIRPGEAATPIGTERVDDFFYADVDTAFLTSVEAAVDPIRHVVFWRYKSTSHTNVATTDKVLVYSYTLNKWSLIEQELSGLFTAATPGYTLDNLETLLGLDLDHLPFSLDSRVWQGGAPLLGGFTSDYKLGFFAGDALEAVIETGSIALTAGRRTFVRGFRPIVDTSSVYGQGASLITHGSTPSWGTEAVAISTTGKVPARSSALLHRFRVRIPAASDWTAIHGVEPDGAPAGMR